MSMVFSAAPSRTVSLRSVPRCISSSGNDNSVSDSVPRDDRPAVRPRLPGSASAEPIPPIPPNSVSKKSLNVLRRPPAPRPNKSSILIVPSKPPPVPQFGGGVKSAPFFQFLTLFGIAQDFVSFLNFFELFLGLLVVRIQVGMVLAGKLPIRLLDFFFFRGSRHAQNFVIIAKLN